MMIGDDGTTTCAPLLNLPGADAHPVGGRSQHHMSPVKSLLSNSEPFAFTCDAHKVRGLECPSPADSLVLTPMPRRLTTTVVLTDTVPPVIVPSRSRTHGGRHVRSLHPAELDSALNSVANCRASALQIELSKRQHPQKLRMSHETPTHSVSYVASSEPLADSSVNELVAHTAAVESLVDGSVDALVETVNVAAGNATVTLALRSTFTPEPDLSLTSSLNERWLFAGHIDLVASNDAISARLPAADESIVKGLQPLAVDTGIIQCLQCKTPGCSGYPLSACSNMYAPLGPTLLRLGMQRDLKLGHPM